MRYRIGLKESVWRGDYAEPTVADMGTVSLMKRKPICGLLRSMRAMPVFITDLGALDLLNAFYHGPSQKTASLFAAQYLSDPLPETRRCVRQIQASDPVSAEIDCFDGSRQRDRVKRLGDGVLRRFVEMRKLPRKGK